MKRSTIRIAAAAAFGLTCFVLSESRLAAQTQQRALAPPPGKFGGGPLHHEGCCGASAADLLRIEEGRRRFPIGALRGAAVAPYPVFPMAGNLDRDIQAGNWVDLDPTPGSRLIWNCTDLAADGHNGVDVELRSFSEQAIGVPVFAAADGVVTATHDGEPDMNTQQLGQPSNLVIINHGGVRETWYLHLKNGSVSVAPGQPVKAGQQIGMVGSSGNSGGPHLHFESRDLPGNTVFEPWAGACRPGDSGWENQPAFDSTLALRDFGVTQYNLAQQPGFPFRTTATGQLAFVDQPHWIWILVSNLPANSTWRITWFLPNNQIAMVTQEFPFGNSEFYRRSWWWFNWYVPDMTAVGGDWKIRIEINGTPVIEAPVKVVQFRDPLDLHLPSPITLEFDPPNPQPGQPVVCRVNTSNTLDDPDYDLVRYTYEWRVNGAVVRSITHAGQSDVVPGDTAGAGQSLSCSVVAGDGTYQRTPVSVAVTVGGPLPCPGDANGDRVVDFDDIISALGNWLANYAPGTGPGDANSDGVVDFDDIIAVLGAWLAPCP